MVTAARVRVSVISGSLVRHDAISASARADVLALHDDPRFKVRAFSYQCAFEDVPYRRVGCVNDLLLDRFYLASDVLIFHFGVFYELFDAVLLGNGRGRTAVRYHNVTPKEFLPPSSGHVTDKSLRQLHNMSSADAIWPVSAYNQRCLAELGFPHDQVEILPLAANGGLAATPAQAKRSALILYVGRFVASKGLFDLVEALALVRKEDAAPFQAILAGSRSFSHRSCIDELHARLASRGLGATVEIREDIPDEELRALYGRALVAAFPSYHEGFCVPVIEALAGGAVPVVSNAAALPETLGGLGRVVPVRSPEALATAISELLRAHQAGAGRLDRVPADRGAMPFAEYRAQVEAHIAVHEPANVAARLRDRVLALAARTDALRALGPAL